LRTMNDGRRTMNESGRRSLFQFWQWPVYEAGDCVWQEGR